MIEKTIHHVIALVALLACAPAGRAAAADAPRADFVVSSKGNDAWTGRTADPAPDGKDGPFASVARAQKAVRELRKAEPNRQSPVVVEIRGGTYFLAEPLAFTPEDSGTAASPTIVRAAMNESPVFSGGVSLKGWKLDDKGRWTLDLPDVKSKSWDFSQLFVSGQRRMRPRFPKDGYFLTAGEVDPSPKAKNQGDDRFRFKAGEMKSSWSNLNDIEVLAFQVWTMARFRVAEINEPDRIVTFTGTTRGRESYAKLSTGRRYIIENVKEALDTPGQWYLDRQAGTLIYLPMPGEDPATTEVIAPRIETLVTFKGDLGARNWVQNIRLEGLTFSHTNWNTPPSGNSFPQAEVNLGAALEAEATRDITLMECQVTHIGSYAVQFGAGCKRDRVERCVLADLGGGGVKIGETGVFDEERAASDDVVRDCLIIGGGRMHPAAVGVWIGQAHDNVVEKNTIRDLYYSGLSVGWTWGYGKSLAHHNRFEANHISQLGQYVLSDMGAFYSLGISPGTVVKGNHFHDVNSFDYGGWGIYFDEGSTDIHAEGNVVYRCKTGNFHQHYGKENVLEHNIFVDAVDPQLARSRSEEHVSFIFRHNVVAYETGNLLGSNWNDDARFVIDENLYWHHGHPVIFAGNDLAAWQKRGHDQHSIIADPKFIDPAHDDFRLQADSPASQIGCPSLDVRAAGCDLPKAFEEAYGNLPRAFPPPPPPQPIADDFEDTAMGQKSALAVTSEENDQATVRVTDETAASGTHSLKFTDAAGQKQGFNPHWYYQTDYSKGVVSAHFALRHEPGAIISHEWRDNTNPYHTGPAIYVDGNGSLHARDRALGTMPAGVWVEFVITCALGTEAKGHYDLELRIPGKEVQRLTNLPCDPQFQALKWFGFSSNAETRTTFYLDDLRLGWTPGPK